MPDASSTQDAPLASTLTHDGAIAPGRHRIHPSYIITSAARVFLTLFISAVVGGISSLYALAESLQQSDSIIMLIVVGGILLVFVIILGIVVLVSWLYYRRFSWEITESDIHIYSGIFMKQQVHIPFYRVQSIDFNAGLIERLLGVVRLKIETAGGSSNKGVLIPALKLGEAEALRAEAFSRKHVQASAAAASADKADGQALSAPSLPRESGVKGALHEIENAGSALRGVFAGDYQESTRVEYEYGLSLKELLLSAVSSDTIPVYFLLVLGALSQAPPFLQLVVPEFSMGSYLSQALEASLPYLVAAVAVVMLVVVVLAFLRTAISYGGFKARRRGGRIEVERGLLSRQYKGVAIGRVQAVQVRQGLIRRLMGYAQLKLLTIDSADASNSQQNSVPQLAHGMVVHPFVKAAQVDAILSGLLPEFDGRPSLGQLCGLVPRALRRSFMRRFLFPMLAAGAALLTVALLVPPLMPAEFRKFTDWALLALVAVFCVASAVCLVGSVLWYRHAGYAYNRSMLVVRQGAFSIETHIVPRRKLQWSATLQNPFQRLGGLASIMTCTAAGIGGTRLVLRDLTLEAATGFLEWTRPQGARPGLSGAAVSADKDSRPLSG
jgi:putative membrane protein